MNRTNFVPFATVATSMAGLRMQAQQTIVFFATSAGPGKGADLSGLAGADQQFQRLTSAGGAGGKTWCVYASTRGGPALCGG